MSGVIITNMNMPDTCKECRKESSFQVVGIDCALLNHKDCCLKSVEGLIEKVEQLKKSCANDSYGKCMTNAISRVEKLIKEYCEVEE